jgi:putative ubiquitin-RnfH superfamily antitoxin RatB of RatAB toxin-antitoxin module
MADSIPVAADIPVQICYASPSESWVVDLKVPLKTTVAQAFELAGLSARFSQALSNGDVGVYGKKVPLDTVLNSHDRIEIYRPLTDLPQNIRRRRVEEIRAQKAERR